MKARLILLSAVAATAFSMHAQLTASKAFSTAPTSVFSLLDKTTRLDMIDYFNSGSNTASTNLLKGSAKISELSPMNLKFKMTDASSYQIAILPASKDSVIAVIETVAMPACDSRMSFYTRDWKRINNHLFIAPSLRDWMTDEGKGRAAEVEALVPFLVVGYDYDPTTRQLRLTNNLDDFLSPDDVAQAHTYFHDELLYHWNGKRMERVK